MTASRFDTVTKNPDSWHVHGTPYEFWRGEWELEHQQNNRLHWWLIVQPLILGITFSALLWMWT